MITSERLDILIKDQSEWSQATFGTYAQRGPIGPLKHLAKECAEAADNPSDIKEHADILILLLDSSCRSRISPWLVVMCAVEESMSDWGVSVACNCNDSVFALCELRLLAETAQEAQAPPIFGRMLYLAVLAARKSDFSFEQVIDAAIDKMAENKQRQWPASPPGNDEPVEHVRDGEPIKTLKEALDKPIRCTDGNVRKLYKIDERFGYYSATSAVGWMDLGATYIAVCRSMFIGGREATDEGSLQGIG